MKGIIAALALALIAIFALNLMNTYRAIKSTSAGFTGDHTTVQYDPGLSSVPGFQETETRMSKMIRGYKEEEKSAGRLSFILNLLVTVITGITALVSTVSTIKNGTISKTAGIWIAIITFIASMLSFGQSELNTRKEELLKNKEKVIEIRREMESLTPAELPASLPRFKRRLDEEF